MESKKGLRIFLGNSPWLKRGFYGVRAGSRWPHFEKKGNRYMPFPFFLAYSAAILEENNFDVLLVDGVAERISEEDFLNRFDSFKPDLIVLEVSTVSLDKDLEIAYSLNKRFKSAARIVFCGLHFEMYNESFLEKYNFVDFVIKGEYEFSLVDLAGFLNNGINISLKNIPGLIYRDTEGAIQNNPIGILDNLDRLPWPARHFLPKDGYEDLPDILPGPTAQMLASRGCPYQCIYCAWPQIMYNSNRYRTRSAEDVAREMEYLVFECGFKSIYFDDDVFNIGKNRVLELCRHIKKRKLNIPWAAMGRADISDKESLEAMVEAGLCAIKYGIESADQAIVNNCGKALDLKKSEENIYIAKKLGLKIHLTFMLGLPGETRETIKKTINFALKIDPYSLQFSIATPFPGSRYFEILDEKGYILSKNWQDYDGYSRAVIRTENLTQHDLENALKDAERIWARHLFFRNISRNRAQYIGKALRYPFYSVRKLFNCLG
jgi:radical SAM superfamily enzyme YgiQ (UPF0313 family)